MKIGYNKKMMDAKPDNLSFYLKSSDAVNRMVQGLGIPDVNAPNVNYSLSSLNKEVFVTVNNYVKSYVKPDSSGQSMIELYPPFVKPIGSFGSPYTNSQLIGGTNVILYVPDENRALSYKRVVGAELDYVALLNKSTNVKKIGNHYLDLGMAAKQYVLEDVCKVNGINVSETSFVSSKAEATYYMYGSLIAMSIGPETLKKAFFNSDYSNVHHQLEQKYSKKFVKDKILNSKSVNHSIVNLVNEFESDGVNVMAQLSNEGGVV